MTASSVSLGYVVLYVKDVSATLTFYEQAFGLTRRFYSNDNWHGYGELDTGAAVNSDRDVYEPDRMHPALQLLLFWVAAFVTLSLSVVLLHLYSNVIDSDATLNSLRAELILAAVVSLMEGASVWAIFTFVPAAVRALFLPALVVALIYKIAHFETWSRYDVSLLLLFQLVLGGSAVLVLTGHFGPALLLLFICGLCLAALAAMVRNL
jgi:hypothetical protein